VKTLAVEFPLAQICRVLGIARSGYYAWLKRQPSQRQRADEQLLPLIKQVHSAARQTYGSPRVTQALKKQNHQCGRHRVARLMRQHGLRGLQSRGFRPRTTDSNHPLPIAPNRLKESFVVCQPNQVWVSDITYIATAQGWLYLAAIMDLCSRKIVGWPRLIISKLHLCKRPCSER